MRDIQWNKLKKLVFVSLPLTLTSLAMPTEPVMLTPYDLKKYRNTQN
jgi:hypothetical protein